MKNIILTVLILFSSHLLANNYSTNNALRQIDLLEYIEIVSNITNKNIYISSEIKNPSKISFFIPKDIHNKFVFLETLNLTLNDKGFRLEQLRDIYIVKKIEKAKENKYHSYSFNYINPKDIKELLSIFEDVKFSYLPSTNSVVYYSSEYLHNKISNFLKFIDIPKEQIKIKITIFSTDFDNLSSIGAKASSVGIDLNNFLTTVASFSSVKTTLSGNNVISFKAALDFLIKEGISTVTQSPTLILRDGEPSSVSYVKNLPYQTSKTIINDGISTTQEVTEYRDVGLKLELKPNVKENYTFLDLNLVIEDLISLDEKPSTQKISYQQKFKLLNDELLFLTGLTQNKEFNNNQKVPLLGDLPILRHLFNYDSKVLKSSVVTIMIQRID